MRSINLFALGAVGLLVTVLAFPGIQASTAQTPSRIVAEEGARVILRCYHRTALFERAVEIAESEPAKRGTWTKLPDGTTASTLRERYDADAVRFIRIYWRGYATGKAYQSDIAMMARSRAGRPEVRTAMLVETSPVPAIDRLCSTAMNWQPQVNGETGTRL